MPSGTNTPNLNLLRIQALWQFGDAAFNRFIDDADNKLVGIAHLTSGMHWTVWKAETEYSKDDVVRWPNLKSHQYARCLEGGISDIESEMPQNNVTGSILTDGTVTWEVMSLTQASANGGIIKTWLGGYTYTRGDAVRYGNALYRAVLDHTSSMDFATDYLKWQEIYASIRFWQPNTYYYLDDTAIYDDIIYKCTRAHKSVANFEDDSSATPPVVGDEADWEIIGGAGGAKDWATNTKYQYGQLVLVNGILYRCNTKHRSSNSFSTDIAYWDLVDAQIHDWQTGQYYVAGTLVAYNNVIYKCLTSHTSSANFETDISNWILYHNHVTIWARNKSYYQGQIVIYTGTDDFRLYRCNTTHVSPNTITENNVTRDATFLDDILNWDALNATIALWNKNVEYKIGDMVVYDNELFRCVKDHKSGNNNDSTIFDDITNVVATNCWERIKVKNPYILQWASNTQYDVNQVVMYHDTLYKCNTFHTSTSTFDTTKWDLVYANIQPWTTNVTYKQDSLVLNSGKLYICIATHTSTVFNDDMGNWLQIGGSGGISEWTATTAYGQDDVVLYNNTLYRCNTTHTSANTFALDIANWDIIYANIPVWATSIYYSAGSLVSNNNLVYKCITGHTSSANFNTDIANWELYNNSITVWAASKSYYVGQTVLYDGVIYRCNTEHISASPFDVTKWDFVWSNIRVYSNNTIYKVGSEVIFNRNLYRCIGSHTSNTDNINSHLIFSDNTDRLRFTFYNYGAYSIPAVPQSDTIDLGASYDIQRIYMLQSGGAAGITLMDIEVSVDGTNFDKIYTYNNPYAGAGYTIDFNTKAYARYIKFTVNGIIYRGGYEIPDGTNIGISVIKVYQPNPYWERIGTTFIEDWKTSYLYNRDDIVLYNGILYRCIIENTSTNFVDDISCWEVLCPVNNWTANTYYPANIFIVNNGVLYRSKESHTSDSTFDGTKWDNLSSAITIATKAQVDALFI